MSLTLCKKDLFYDDLEISNKEELFDFIIKELTEKERIENPERILEKMNNKEKQIKKQKSYRKYSYVYTS